MKRGLLIGLIAAGVLVVLLWWFLLWSPTSKDLDDTKTKTESAERAQDSLRATLNRLQALARNAPQQEATLRRLDAAVPETPDLAAFIIEANRIAAESGIEFLSIAPAPPAAGAAGGTSTINLTISVRGGFFQVLEYLNRIEDLERLVVIDTINLGGDTAAAPTAPAASATSGAGTLAVSLTGRMFTRAAAVGGTAAPGGTPAPGGGTTTPTTPGGSTTAPTVPNTPVTPSTNATTTTGASGSGNS